MQVGTLPVVAAVLVFLNGLYILIVAFGNITDFGTNREFVQHVLSMDTTNFGAEPGTGLDNDVMWRAIENETIQDMAYVGLIAWESATALILMAATALWVRERGTGYRLRPAGVDYRTAHADRPLSRWLHRHRWRMVPDVEIDRLERVGPGLP